MNIDIEKYLEKLECPICQDIMVEACETSCGHSFCEYCIDSCLETRVNKCPVCNKDPTPVHPSFTLRAICDSVRALRDPSLPLSSSPTSSSDFPPSFDATTATTTTTSTSSSSSSTEHDPVTAEQEKQLGNEKYGQKKYAEAIQHYSKALAKSPTLDPKNAVIYNNRAQCYIKIEQHRRALDDCEEAIRLDPHDVKAFMRKGLCLYRMGNYLKSRDAYNEARQLDTQNKWKEAIDEALLSLPNPGLQTQPLPAAPPQFYVPQGNYAPYPYPPPQQQQQQQPQQRYNAYPGQYQYYPNTTNAATSQTTTTPASTSTTGRAPSTAYPYPPYTSSTSSSSSSSRRRGSNNPSHPDGCSIQ